MWQYKVGQDSDGFAGLLLDLVSGTNGTSKSSTTHFYLVLVCVPTCVQNIFKKFCPVPWYNACYENEQSVFV